MPEVFDQKVMRRLRRSKPLTQLAAHILGMKRPAMTLSSYRPLPLAPQNAENISNMGPVFITSRFRSGSTLLWQLFNHIADVNAYYEPLNERQWFDADTRGERVDSSHRGVTSYYDAYEGLKDVSALFKESWTDHRLMMGEHNKDAALKDYIHSIVKHSDKRAVLQFNRVDFRLPWLKANFPQATIVHLERNPRDVWVSNLSGVENDPNWTIETFEGVSGFYLLQWYRDLIIDCPVLIQDPHHTHPYFIHYMIWRLSGLMAADYAGYFLKYDDLCNDTEIQLTQFLEGLSIKNIDIKALSKLISKRSKPYQHDDGFYQGIEDQVDQFLECVLG